MAVPIYIPTKIIPFSPLPISVISYLFDTSHANKYNVDSVYISMILNIFSYTSGSFLCLLEEMSTQVFHTFLNGVIIIIIIIFSIELWEFLIYIKY